VTVDAANRRDALAQRLRALLASHQNVREVRMFGGLSFLVDDRMAVAAGRDGDLLVRTDPMLYEDLLQRGGQPAYMGEKRPMGSGWLSVPYDRILGDAALAFWSKTGIDSGNAPD
jgi:TfoX/Sxy family transcriptional regulator of competence genes